MSDPTVLVAGLQFLVAVTVALIALIRTITNRQAMDTGIQNVCNLVKEETSKTVYVTHQVLDEKFNQLSRVLQREMQIRLDKEMENLRRWLISQKGGGNDKSTL